MATWGGELVKPTCWLPAPPWLLEGLMPEIVVFLGQAALVLAAFLVVLLLLVSVLTLLIWAGRKIRQLYEL